MMPVYTWTPDMKAELQRLLGDPCLSYTTISARMSEKFGTEVTRNACIGKARRLGLATKNGVPRKAPPGPAAKNKVVAFRRPPVKVDAPIEYQWHKPRDGGGGVNIYQLRHNSCRWPLGGPLLRPPYQYCGCRALPGGPYCAEHAKRSRGSGFRIQP